MFRVIELDTKDIQAILEDRDELEVGETIHSISFGPHSVIIEIERANGGRDNNRL